MNMNKIRTGIFTAAAIAALTFAGQAFAQSDDAEELKIAALEALIAAPPERALPLAIKALQGKHSDEVKSRALFILSQIDLPEAQDVLIDTARQESGEIRLQAIRMIGIGGNPDSLTQLGELYDAGDGDVREAVLQAFMIANDEDAIYELALRAHAAGNMDDFEHAVRLLGAIGAEEQLQKIRENAGPSQSLIHAYAISGDAESLRAIALDTSDTEMQIEAIRALGIVGSDAVNATLMEIYKSSDSDEINDAALHGMLIAGYDEGVLELYRASQDPAEKRELLEFLVIMGSDNVWDVIDSALDGGF